MAHLEIQVLRQLKRTLIWLERFYDFLLGRKHRHRRKSDPHSCKQIEKSKVENWNLVGALNSSAIFII